ncbi:MAG: hypothetical protein KGJ06_03880, partial [Pseudomonadota bacterium]|nr:hypothetical protein [Pseudomonadota bacterium]
LLGLMLNLLIAALLAVTIAYCWALNRRIRILQDSKSELAQLLKHFDESTQRASESIIALQTASKKIGENIQFRIDKANYLLDDLTFMIDRGSKLASQMEAGFAVGRARSKVLAEEPAREEAPEAPRPAPAPPVTEKAVREAHKTALHEKTTATLEAMLERVTARHKAESEEEEAPRRPPQPTAARSRAEQELLDMIKAGIKG